MRYSLAVLASGFSVWSFSAQAYTLDSTQCKPWKHTFGDMNESIALDLSAELCLILPENAPSNLRGAAVDTSAAATVVTEKGDNRLTVAKWRGSMEVTEDGRGLIKGAVLAAGQEIWKGQWSVGRQEISKEIELVNIEQKYVKSIMVGVVPASLSVGIRSSGNIHLNAGVGVQTATFATVPTINGDLYAEAGIGSEEIFIGVQGGAEVVRERLVAGATLSIVPPLTEGAKTGLRAEYKGNNAVTALKGGVTALVKATGGFEQKFEVYSWPGYAKDFEIFNGIWRKDF